MDRTGLDMVFVINEISGLLPAHDTSVALMEAAQQRGHRVLVTTAAELEFDRGATVAHTGLVPRADPLAVALGHDLASPASASVSCTLTTRSRIMLSTMKSSTHGR